MLAANDNMPAPISSGIEAWGATPDEQKSRFGELCENLPAETFQLCDAAVGKINVTDLTA
ncbi:hypothetical protein [Methylobacterium brachythecii]|uniref:Uncharacterized protein n=1 Tax=Methylobacterium brachythecii TaxID=1176177 RepID=A0A7W6F8T0_9HYPH|nr:hypothetical protein [Methylobacterium brachythecii]MBB3904774.1 hypothetical protein [Methylobacterium brachythecii]